MKRRAVWVGLLSLAFFLAACGGGGGAPPPGTGCDPAKFDSGCAFDGGAKFGIKVGASQVKRG